MNENGKVSFFYSWPIIVLAIILFWPLGVILLIRRISIDRKTSMQAAKFANVCGIILYVIAGLGILAYIADGFDVDGTIGIIFFIIAGAVLRHIAKKSKRESEKVKKYLSIIINGNETNLDNIASATQQSYEVVKTDVTNMIQKGYLKDAYINEQLHEIILQNRAPFVNSVTEPTTAQATTGQPHVVTCKCCGANNTITGDVGECEYCGSHIS